MTQDMGNNISYCSKALAREMARSKQALGRLMSMLRDCSATLRPQVRECLHFATPHSDQWSENAWSMARIWSENVFVRKERTLSPSRTNSQSVGHGLRFIRYAAMLLLMMVVGVNCAWAQTDYSGVYYIANKIWNGDHSKSTQEGYEDYFYSVEKPDKNWYMVPAADPHQTNKEDAYYSADYTANNGDPEKPFLTTNRTNRDNNSIWIVKKTGNKYYLIHALTGRYVKYEPPTKVAATGSYQNNPVNRRSMHLEAWTDPDNDPGNVFKFTISTKTENNILGFNIKPTQADGTDVAGYFNPAGDNWEYYYAHTKKDNYWVVGLVGYYNSTSNGSLWPYENAKAALTPTISDINTSNNTFTITCGFVPTGCSIVYTTDGTDPSSSNGTTYSSAVPVTSTITVKAAVVGYGMVLSNIDYKSLSPVIIAPTVTNNYDGTISLSSTTPNAKIYYTTDDTTPSSSNGTLYDNIPFSLGNATVIKAITYNSDLSGSSGVTTYNVPQYTAPTISFSSTTSQVTISCAGATNIYYTIDGSTPTTSSTLYSAPFTVSSAATIKAIATHAGYLTSEVATFAITQVATPTITINADNSVTIACATDGATIYYKTGDDDPTTENATEGTSIASILPSQGPIKAFAVKDGLINSNIETESNIPAKTIAVSSSNGSLTSADPIVYNGTAHQPAFTITDGETTINSGEYTSAYSDNTNAGTATITITDKEDGDYDVSGSFTFTITQIALTITADDKNVIYGSAAPTYTFSYSGFVNNEDATALTTAPTATCSYTSTSNAGTYDIEPSGGEATNYSFTYENGTLTVDPKTVKDNPDTEAGESAINIVLTGIPVGNFTYDRTAKTPTVTVKDGETVIASSEYTLDLSDNTNAGTATVTITDNDGGNYNVSGTATFTINPAALTITPNSGQSKCYGDPDPVLTYTNVGLVVGDELAGTLGRATGENAGTYAINQGTLDNSNNPNYAITFTTGKTFTITPKSLGDTTDPAENITIEITDADEDHVIVKQGEKDLTAGTDYTITTTVSADNKYFEVTITGANNYEGSFTTKFANVTFGTKNNNYYWGTFVSNSNDGNFAVPSNMEAYIVTGINASAGTVEVEQLDNIPEQEPVLLLTNKNAHGFIVKTKDGGTTPTGENMLKVESTDKYVATAEIYVLYKGEFVLNAAGTLPKGKVYLPKPGGVPAPAILTIDWDATTGVDNAQLSTSDAQLSGTWYTLEGIKLNGRPTKRGLYLRDGKKIVVK